MNTQELILPKETYTYDAQLRTLLDVSPLIVVGLFLFIGMYYIKEAKLTIILTVASACCFGAGAYWFFH